MAIISIHLWSAYQCIFKTEVATPSFSKLQIPAAICMATASQPHIRWASFFLFFLFLETAAAFWEKGTLWSGFIAYFYVQFDLISVKMWHWEQRFKRGNEERDRVNSFINVWNKLRGNPNVRKAAIKNCYSSFEPMKDHSCGWWQIMRGLCVCVCLCVHTYNIYI